MNITVYDYSGHVDIEIVRVMPKTARVKHQIPKYLSQGLNLETLWDIGECVGREYPADCEDVNYVGTPNTCAGFVIGGIQAGIYAVREMYQVTGPAGGQILVQRPKQA